MLLKGKTAFVTGGGSGMGKAICRLFAKEGAQVAVVDLNGESAGATAGECGPLALALQTNAADAGSVESAVNRTVEQFGSLDIVVNCAGVPMAFTPIEEVSEEQWQRTMDVNVKSIYLTSKYAVPRMKQQGSGSILNICSIAGVRARPGLNAYCASKGAAIMLTKALAIELAPYRIRVNGINPGPAETPMLSKFMHGDAEQIEKDTKDIFLSSVPLGALIQPDDIAQAALYLCSDLAKIVTGEIVNVDGGRGI
ncbi:MULTISPECIES: SDR family oxidoreductase [Brevibacillus]|jgi:3-oxoacyl-[acyl-carrier protein] reductase|uniref:Oxidoreductase n=1 Tax=Brevibacillus borstelensis AK1 TaxID=1300222 RepID=M8EDC7_9BACL|nr:SDR family oxidoreductase [Brevibacillus borstelensis]EMT53495.1 oxidoreductase [Brevibacillus borstelensis AK1]MCC0565501.1 SDR family oxidoreductase [Brevibacillus borstelensis]MCM3469388.1 SDR family oxidoreductase [Brevibacillus borstelensis]MCM3557274.1 SDR family oxidoreductase [Brevibacillus borstelensis]MCM3623025.1 SDR family oxidoreductase [Brevibacillus borstelensis]